MENCNILYTKILFPIEESKSKLLIEIVFEIIMEMHIEYLRNPKKQHLQISEYLLKKLFKEEEILANLSANIKHNKTNNKIEGSGTYSPFYIMDKISFYANDIYPSQNLRISDDIIISKNFYELRDYISKKYKEERNLFSTCILFCIKLILSIKDLKEFYSINKSNLISSEISHSSNIEANNDFKNKDNGNAINLNDPNEDLFIKELKIQFINLTKDVLKINKENASSNPFQSKGYYHKNIYDYFLSFIVKKLSFIKGDPLLKIDELIESLSKYRSDLKVFARVIYTMDGSTKIYRENLYIQNMNMIKNEMNEDNEFNSNKLKKFLNF